jgi:integrase
MNIIKKRRIALTAREVKFLPEGLHRDQAGLYCQVAKTGARCWIFRFQLNGRARAMGLGSVELVSLAQARALAAEARKLARSGIDPIEARRLERQQARKDDARAMSFDACAAAYIESHRQGWKNAKHAWQWETTLRNHASPIIGMLNVADVELGHILKIIEPIWGTKTETASRLRGRIESVLDWATVRGYRKGENPARWRGHLDKILPQRSKVQKVEHHKSLPYGELPAFMADLRERPGTSARALEFLILTGARSGEIREATWGEFDLDSGLWTIPAARMKAGKEHRVPLVGRALAIVQELTAVPLGPFVFPAPTHEHKPLSDAAFKALLKRMKMDAYVPHGFRSTFRDWAAECTPVPHEVCEQALAHTITNAVERAYRRGDLFEKRRQLMAAWAKFCTSPAPTAGSLTAIRAQA